jgi:hypothetical protein
MLRICLAAIAGFACLAPALAADSSKEMSPASRVMSVVDQPVLNRNISADRSDQTISLGAADIATQPADAKSGRAEN